MCKFAVHLVIMLCFVTGQARSFMIRADQDQEIKTEITEAMKGLQSQYTPLEIEVEIVYEKSLDNNKKEKPNKKQTILIDGDNSVYIAKVTQIDGHKKLRCNQLRFKGN